MGILEDVMKALDRVPIWKRLQGLPDEVDRLRQRITELEKSLEKSPAEGCPFCGARAWRLQRVDMHGRREVWHCLECKKEREIRLDMNRAGTFGR